LDRYEFYKNWYYKEHERKQQLESSLSIPLLIVTLVGSGLIYLISNFDPKVAGDIHKVFFYIFFFMSFAFLIAAIVTFAISFNRAIYGFEYAFLDWPHVIEEDIDKIDRDENLVNLGLEPEEEKKEYMIDTFIAFTTINKEINNFKSAYIYQSKKFLICAVAALMLCLFPYGINFFSKTDMVQKIEIINND